MGFTLIELLLVSAIVGSLAAFLVSVTVVVMRQVKQQHARQMIGQLSAALRTYALDDKRHRFPLHGQLYPAPSLTIPQAIALHPQGDVAVGVLGMLIAMDAGVAGKLDADQQLLDPWARPYCYQLTRPTPPAPPAGLSDWNWNATAGRPSAWNAMVDIPAPYPYVWSYGQIGNASDATGWIYEPSD